MEIQFLEQLLLLLYSVYLTSLLYAAWLVFYRNDQSRWVGVVLFMEASVGIILLTLMSSPSFVGGGGGLIGLRIRTLLQQITTIFLPILLGVLSVSLIARTVNRISPKGRINLAILFPVVIVPIIGFLTTTELIARTNRSRPTPPEPSEGELPIKSGFVLERINIDRIQNPTSINFGPDGSLYISSYPGSIWRIPFEAGELQVDGTVEFIGGFKVPVGLAFDGDVLYVASHVTVTRLITDGRGEYIEARDIVTGLPARKYPWHANNDFVVGPDGHLYFAVGLTPDASEETEQFAASVLRVDPYDGGIEIFATGERNPFDLVFNAEGDPFKTDNGFDGL